MRRGSTYSVGDELVYTHSRVDTCQKGMLRFDLYKQPFRLLLPDGKNEYRTCGGTLLSLCSAFVVIAFATLQVTKLIDRSEFSIIHEAEENYFADTVPLSEMENFYIAAGITAYDGKKTELTPDIGTIKFYHKTWSQSAGIEFKEVDTRPCTQEDFNYGDIGNENSRFFETKQTIGDLKTYGSSMRCVTNPEDMYIFGNYNTGNAANLMVVFELCNQ